jgi:hypothetical protein
MHAKLEANLLATIFNYVLKIDLSIFADTRSFRKAINIQDKTYLYIAMAALESLEKIFCGFIR